MRFVHAVKTVATVGRELVFAYQEVPLPLDPEVVVVLMLNLYCACRTYGSPPG
jgi:hypothetical protein